LLGRGAKPGMFLLIFFKLCPVWGVNPEAVFLVKCDPSMNEL
jgi:hypothetical protein